MLDLKIVPFSRFGSYFSISEIDNSIFLRDMHCGDEAPFNTFKLSFYKKDSLITPKVEYTETSLRFFSETDENSFVELVYGKANTLNILAKNMVLVLEAIKSRYDSFMPYGENLWLYELYTKEIKYSFKKLYGDFTVIAPWKVVGNESITLSLNGEVEETYIVIEDFKTVSTTETYQSFKDAKNEVAEDFENYKSKFICYKEDYRPSFDIAIYITWSCIVRPFGLLDSPAMYMSKNWMNNIWSWDNCFNAMMLKDNFLDLSLKQFELFANNQDEYGQYPDFINDKYKSFNCVKPPIHAFALKKIFDISSDKDRFLPLLESIEKSTYFWLKHRRKKDMPYPFYHHGNDSGWDNATIFHKELPVISPDLTAYLIAQLDYLSSMYKDLGLCDKANHMKDEADKLFDGFLDYFYDDGFVAKTLVGEKVIKSDSLILYLPIVIGYRFEKNFLDNLVKSLLENHLENFGLATEKTTSPLYKYNGYWQGPIWAPTTYIFIDALRKNGYLEEAFEIAKRFCDLTLVGQMAENFDPISGEGLVDKAFTWTSSVFLLLQKEFFSK